MAFKLKITLINSEPLIWRSVLIRPEINFLDLHLIIQGAMGWENSHLFSFFHEEKSRDRIGLLTEDDYIDEGIRDASLIKVSDELNRNSTTIYYEYDLGDSWVHKVEFEENTEDKILPKAICIDGGGACPPEDCGGIPGYYQLVKALNNPKTDEDRNWIEWMGMSVGDTWDVNLFDLDTMNSGIQTFLNDPYYF